jgi:hypothetical protein
VTGVQTCALPIYQLRITGRFYDGKNSQFKTFNTIPTDLLIKLYQHNIYDQDRHLLFTNRDKKNAPYWDFKVKSTLETIIEAQLDANRNPGSGCAVMLIGFKQK